MIEEEKRKVFWMMGRFRDESVVEGDVWWVGRMVCLLVKDFDGGVWKNTLLKSFA